MILNSCLTDIKGLSQKSSRWEVTSTFCLFFTLKVGENTYILQESHL